MITNSRTAATSSIEREQALNEVQCRDLFSNIREGFFVGEIVRDAAGKPVDFVFLEVNPAFTLQTGLDPDATVGRRVTEVIPGTASELIGTYGKVVDSGQPAAFEIEIPALAHRSYEARAHSLGGERFAVLFLEITERKRVEKALAESRAMLSDIVETVDQIVWSARPDGYHDFFNGRWYEFTGAKPGTTEGDAWADLFHPDDRERTFERWRHCLRTGEPYEIEYRARHRSGQYRWLLGRAHPVRNEAGEIIRWMGTCTDVDDAKRAEAELRESEEQFHTMADALPQLAWMADERGWIYWYNRRWYEYTGTSLEEMEGWGWRKVHHPDHVDRVVERIRHSWETGEPWEDTFPLRGADGRYRWFLSRATPLRNTEGRVTRWFGTNTDITEQKALEEQLELATSELSHRIKNIFAVASALVALSLREHPEAKDFAKDFRLRLDALNRAHNYARPHGKGPSPATEHATVLGLIRQLLQPYALEGRDRILVEGDDAPLNDRASTPLSLAMHDLATNATKYGAFSTPAGLVRVRGERADDTYRLCWTESGGPPVREPEHFGFGSRLVEVSLQNQLGGKLVRDWKPEGLEVCLSAPVGELVADD